MYFGILKLNKIIKCTKIARRELMLWDIFTCLVFLPAIWPVYLIRTLKIKDFNK
jgi:hypothetical protein